VIAGGVPLWKMPADQEQTVLDVDLGGVIKLARAAIPALLRRPEPRSGRFMDVAVCGRDQRDADDRRLLRGQWPGSLA